MSTSMNPDEGLTREEYDHIPVTHVTNWQTATSDEIFSEMQKMINTFQLINPKASSRLFGFVPTIKCQKVKKGPGTYRKVAVY